MERIQILEMLERKYWFMASSEEIRAALAALPPKWDGFLTDLAARADVIGGIAVKNIKAFSTDPGMFGGLITFSTEDATGKPGSYMYFSWRQGPVSGSKALVFISDPKGIVTHFIQLKAQKFALGGLMVDDAPGGFGDVGEAVKGTMIRELGEEISTDVVIESIVPLGQYHPDAGMTNNFPAIFYVIVSMEIPEESEIDSAHKDGAEVVAKYRIRPISEFWNMVEETTDGLTLAIAAKMAAKKVNFI